MKATAPEQCWGTRGTCPQTPASFFCHFPQAGGSAAPKLHLGAPRTQSPLPAQSPPPSHSSSFTGGFSADLGREAATPEPPPGLQARDSTHTCYGGSRSIPTPTGRTGFVPLVLLLP